MNLNTELKLRRLRQVIGLRTRVRRGLQRTYYLVRGARVPPVRFVLLFNGRTGSSLLRQTLRPHPNLIFEDEHIEGKPANYQRQWIRELYSEKRLPWITTVGFKLKSRDIADAAELRGLLRQFNVRVIHMIRHNTVKAAVSWLNMVRLYEATGKWNRSPADPPLGPLRPSIDELTATIDQRVRLDQHLEEFVRSIDQPRLTVSYEDLLADQAGVVTCVQKFLDLPRSEEPVTCNLVKNTNDDLRQALANFEQLREQFAGTRFEAMFDDRA